MTDSTPPKTLGDRIRHSEDLGKLVRQARAEQSLLQIDLAGLAGTGNRFIVDLERGKPTLQLQKVLDVLDLMGLEVIVQRKGIHQHGE
ncbi:helix-turn-helix transcriptional regulator [Chromohalobacter beijerinckii]|jgi:y4mF family transcriptional regulator|uniref:Helix-turn-helix transcriptional regulator n=2 Tax=Chromohalobacter TaxID=42054 RepID=A0A9X2X0N8_9GAMM|nr:MULTISPECIES: helix-turn-helix transcriptional regulator [Chromohalobacter]CDQ33711.1 transcriptional regulator, y4mF family [Virgibacillus halodenitrificans]MCK0767057.1 helix-turn-helix transcriptional regulator [Chromohalobacter beijerinckii]MCK2041333.1 helix-turn-helix transcriptional regulator [Chromohalobacter moromii]MCK2044275.1 helix-turn-helix transcriptional regulator [Chromohalobacter moromii]MCT8504565.1 helix-turn-helix transcriptional regulator [Chromohalobacter moromii]